MPRTAGAQSPPGSNNTQKNKQIVWQGEEEVSGQEKGNGVVNPAAGGCNQAQYDFKIRFRFVQELAHKGKPQKWPSKRYDWSGQGRAETNGYWNESCQAGSSFEFGPNETQAEELNMIRTAITCKRRAESNNLVFTCGAKPSISLPTIVEWDKLRDNCSYSTASDRNGYDDISQVQTQTHYRYSVWVAPQSDAVMKVKTVKKGPNSQYYNFVPEPGDTISFLVKSTIPSLFRFTLENVSNLPGYAMNASVDDSFFQLFPGLQHLKGQYQNDSPDLIFDPAQYKDRTLWKAPSFGEVETVKYGNAASVTVTAMDYGAYGHLHAYFKGMCGGWTPVTVKWEPVASNNSAQSGITIPMDQDDNLIADRLDQANNGITPWGYAGDPGSDDDKDPRGDGVAGDGLTAFEEYRGFMIKSGDCNDPLKVTHIRTDPGHKDLFIRSDDPMLERMVTMFSYVSGLQVHPLCPRQYQGDNTRIVNFTLHSGQLRSGAGSIELEGKTISQDAPQHGLYLSNRTLDGGKLGETSPSIGPPRRVAVVKVDKAKCMRIGGAKGPIILASTIFHELGHAIGIEHHGQGNIEGPIVIMNAPICPNGTTAGTVAGAHACKVGWIAMRKQQNSGEQSCPMKYIWWSWYVPSSSSLTAVGNGTVTFIHGTTTEPLLGYVGQLKLYRTDLDSPGLSEFCNSQKGTGINGLPGDANHAGDAERGICASQIHVNDVR